MDRRSFLKTAAAAGLAAGISPPLANAAPVQVPRRSLGRTGEQLSVIGFGGIVVMKQEQEHANRSVARAVEEHGINYFDVAPSYGDAEERLGPALEPYRQRCFLACKTTERTAVGSRRELESTLVRMRTDHVDLYQLHAIRSLEDVETAFGPGGAMETFTRAREEGKIRFLGFSAHGVEAALAALERFEFDTTLFPINYALWTRENFGPQVIGLAREQGIGILVLKALARGQWPEGAVRHHEPCWYDPVVDLEETRLSLAFALSQGGTAILPPGNEELFWQAVQASADLPRFTRPAEYRLRQLTAEVIPLFTYASTEKEEG
jgi:aryl-alcohol dehydrogenase-like predicted oxidoreductase